MWWSCRHPREHGSARAVDDEIRIVLGPWVPGAKAAAYLVACLLQGRFHALDLVCPVLLGTRRHRSVLPRTPELLGWAPAHPRADIGVRRPYGLSDGTHDAHAGARRPCSNACLPPGSIHHTARVRVGMPGGTPVMRRNRLHTLPCLGRHPNRGQSGGHPIHQKFGSPMRAQRALTAVALYHIAQGFEGVSGHGKPLAPVLLSSRRNMTCPWIAT